MELPTGPDVVGLEPIVLPCAIELGTLGADDLGFKVFAPRCRYGAAIYLAWLVMPSGNVVGADLDDAVVGGQHAWYTRPVGPSPVRIELHMLALWELQGLDSLKPAELLEALTHPLAEVRQGAIVALGAQPRDTFTP